MRGQLRAVLLGLVVGTASVGLPAVAASAAPPAARPFVHGTQTVPTYSYAKAIRETVFVQAPFDSDHDGKPDRIAADIVRPAEAQAAGVKVPVIMEASPYYQCCGRGNESETKTYDADGTIAKMPLFYDNYFVPRGYAFVGVDLTGTARSTGCGDVGGRDEILGAKAVIDWLNGRARAVDLHGSPVSADWTTGRVGMIGKSWDATIANGVAATGVEGLATIVPVSGISSWYDYTRFNGVLRSPDYVHFLDTYVGGRPKKVCGPVYRADQAASDDATGDYNAFWAERNYRPDAARVRASVFVVHGLNDQNVTTNQFATWWQDLAAHGVQRKIWLSQDGHVDPFDYRRANWVHTLHRWFDYTLQGLDNGIMSEPQATVQRADGSWYTESSWPAPGTSSVGYPLSALGGDQTFTDRPNLAEADAVADPTASMRGRAVFLSGALTHSLHVSGSPSVTLRVSVDRPTTELSVRLVEYGTQRRVDYESPGEGISTLDTQSCWGESTSYDDACYFDTAQDYVRTDVDILSRGWIDAAHHLTLTKVTPLVPGRSYTIRIPLSAMDTTFAAGHRLGVVVTQSDRQYTFPKPTGATVSVDASRSSLSLPVSGAASLPDAATSGATASGSATARTVTIPSTRTNAISPLVVPQG